MNMLDRVRRVDLSRPWPPRAPKLRRATEAPVRAPFFGPLAAPPPGPCQGCPRADRCRDADIACADFVDFVHQQSRPRVVRGPTGPDYRHPSSAGFDLAFERGAYQSAGAWAISSALRRLRRGEAEALVEERGQ